eukprot:TRINITY_DN2249_c0_g1_i1.p1 TRINITY_DN2249_c0_g1~~TRINITY_DN2249_c0_g1_i1.p1  ORF type:complete len:110 (-),score=1.03 TRINITY_DN2249_c0_g1_i1:31-360(-)
MPIKIYTFSYFSPATVKYPFQSQFSNGLRRTPPHFLISFFVRHSHQSQLVYLKTSHSDCISEYLDEILGITFLNEIVASKINKRFEFNCIFQKKKGLNTKMFRKRLKKS